MIDWDDAFDNMGYSPNAAALPDTWAKEAQAFRDGLSATEQMSCDLRYGDDPRETLDVFSPKGQSAGLVVFVHGGYWLKFDKSYWSHFAAGCLARGWTVAMPSYPLAPAARISEITDAIARAVAFCAEMVPGPLRLAGHSAGGHLVSRMICEGMLPNDITARLKHVVSISGLHALEPLLQIKMNTQLQLDAEEAQRESPANLTPIQGVPFHAWVGAAERPEFLRQTRLIEEIWGLKGIKASATFDPGHDHFTVIEALCDAHSPLTNKILEDG